MATRSTIAILQTNGTVKQIYCHWDGYPEHNGEILKMHYRTPNLVKDLISKGDLSVLGKRVNPANPGHSFDNPHRGVCVYYGRDRGESNTETRFYDSLKDLKQNGRREEYNYIYDESQERWFLLSELNQLREFLQEIDEEEFNAKQLANALETLNFDVDSLVSWMTSTPNVAELCSFDEVEYNTAVYVLKRLSNLKKSA